jgi:CHAD domain-containing protein
VYLFQTNLLNLLPFLTRLHENLRRVNNRVNKYLRDPNEKQIHDIRTAIRRLEAAFSTLPKNYRKAIPLSEYVLTCKNLFKVNSEIRDIDIISQKLQKYPVNDHRDRIIQILKETRATKLERAKEIALSLKNTDISKILDKIDVTEKNLQKRYNKILSRLISRLESNFPIVIIDSSSIEELHDLRKFCKKLRYMLELLLDDNKSAVGQMRKTLQKIQDILGAIHDYDFTIQYLKSVENLSKEIQEIIDTETDERRIKYEEFLKFCKRRLHISPDSFLIKIRRLRAT